MILTVTCVKCGAMYAMQVPSRHYQKWQNGETLDDAFPYMTKADKDMLISKHCPECWQIELEKINKEYGELT